MRLHFACALAALVLIWPLGAQEPASKPVESRPMTAREQVDVITKKYDDDMQAFFKVYNATKTTEEKERLFKEKCPKASPWFPKLVAIAKSDPKGSGAESALLWIVDHEKTGAAFGEALDILARDHIESQGVGDVTFALARAVSGKASSFLKTLEEKNPNREIKARALYASAAQRTNLAETAETVRALKELKDEFSPEDLARLLAVDLAKNGKEIEEILVRVKETYGAVESGEGGTFGDRADADLFEIRNLAIGKVAPEIAGEDIEGRPLKLSDFRGKVVVLDFWGFW